MAPIDPLLHSPTSSNSSARTVDSPSITLSVPSSPLYCSSESSLDSLPPSPRAFLSPPPLTEPVGNHDKALQEDQPMASAPARIFIALAVLFGTPIYLYKCFLSSTVVGNLAMVRDTWDSLLHFSGVHIGILTLMVAVYFGPCCLERCSCGCDHGRASKSSCGGGEDRWSVRLSQCTGMTGNASHTFLRRSRAFLSTVDGVALTLAILLIIPLTFLGSFPMLTPGWLWFPFAWMDYGIYRPSDLAPAMQGMCLNQRVHEIHLPPQPWLPSLFHQEPSQEDRRSLPLCLSEKSWDALSAGALSSFRPDDVKAVFKGIDYVQTASRGLAVAVLARDIKGSLPAFRLNVESLKAFIPKLSVVIFENDSSDGSREAIKEWAELADGYHVDLMECPEASDCKFGKRHRDNEGINYSRSKAVGDMDLYRQRVTDYITESSIYKDYTHMMVIDIDLGVSVSPLGVLHSLGEHPENAIASSGRQLLPFSMGTLAPPYDMSAFRPWATKENHWVLSLHESFCALMPPGDRWRNSCDAPSPYLLMELLRVDRGHADTTGFYRVGSAFNGAVLYPLDEIRESHATYDAGEDGQRCEHIGFNLALKKPMYVNRKWDFHVDPTKPGGPVGWRARNAVAYITGTPRIVGTLVGTQILAFFIFIHSIATLGVFVVYPLLAPLLLGSKSIQRLIFAHHLSNKKRGRMQGRKAASEEETLYKIV